MSSDARNRIGGFLLVASGASGSGKSSICARLCEMAPDRYLLSISATTRRPRGKERDGVEYHFLDESAFAAMIERDELLEYAGVHGKRYGTPRRNLEQARAEKRALLLVIDVQGGTRLKALGLPGVWVWIKAPTEELLANRLARRGTETSDQIKMRLEVAAKEEAAAQSVYDHFVINDELERAAREIDALVSQALSTKK